MSSSNPEHSQASSPHPQEPADVDALLSESLKAQSEQDFTWKEPERKPRWWERAEAQAPGSESAEMAPRPSSEVRGSHSASDRSRGGVRPGSVIFALAALALAGWVIVSVVFVVTVDPIVVGLVVSALAGLSLVAAGLRPKPGRRI